MIRNREHVLDQLADFVSVGRVRKLGTAQSSARRSANGATEA